MRGKVSVYKHDEFDENGDPIELTFVRKATNNKNDDDESDDDDENGEKKDENELKTKKKTTKSQRIRAKLGNYILSLGSGSGFGEMALVNENPRNASIIAGDY